MIFFLLISDLFLLTFNNLKMKASVSKDFKKDLAKIQRGGSGEIQNKHLGRAKKTLSLTGIGIGKTVSEVSNLGESDPSLDVCESSSCKKTCEMSSEELIKCMKNAIFDLKNEVIRYKEKKEMYSTDQSTEKSNGDFYYFTLETEGKENVFKKERKDRGGFSVIQKKIEKLQEEICVSEENIQKMKIEREVTVRDLEMKLSDQIVRKSACCTHCEII